MSTKFDGGKARVDILPPHAMLAVGRVFGYGNKKYSHSARVYENNYLQPGMNYSRLFGAALRHLWAWWGGEHNDPETGESHLAHAAACVLMLLDYETRGTYLEFDDRLSAINVEGHKLLQVAKGENK